jgi:hypothetical protein
MPPRQFLGTTAEVTAIVFSSIWQGILVALLLVVGYSGFRGLLRNRWAAVAIIMVFLGFQDVLTSSNPLITFLFTVPSVLIMALVIGFLGPLSSAVAFSLGNLVYRISAAGTGAWYSTRSWAFLLFIVAVAAYGFRCAIAGRQLFGSADEQARASSAASS